MSKRRIKSQEALSAEINVVPYIDVMLVLLIIFMITAPMLTQGVKIRMPQAQAKAIHTEAEIPLIISVDKDKNYYLNVVEKPDLPMSLGDLVVRVVAELNLDQEQKQQQRQVLVKADRAVDYGTVVSAMVLLQKAGVDEVGLMTEPGQEVKKVT